VLDGDPPPHGKGHSSPLLFGPLLWPASPQARILPVFSTRQCAAVVSRGNPTGIATRLVGITLQIWEEKKSKILRLPYVDVNREIACVRAVQTRALKKNTKTTTIVIVTTRIAEYK